MKKNLRFVVIAIIILWSCSAARAAEVTLIAPGGIRAAVEQMIPAFEKSTGHKVKATFGSGGGTPSSKLSAASPSTCRSCNCRWSL